ncbi:uncharacterized protein LOC116186174 [Apis dorsata]|uniref:uncharacterized protein LOC116186174 n=1 Tax=Apis dorsata TaxID=7462 RepID=UPI001292EEE5|nr:uncharacterized protein LOC116186174 [Apis dorsata]
MSDNNYISLKKPQKKKHLQEFLTPIFRINSEESLIRNRKFLKDLELAKARLRTYAAYTPTDRELQQRVMEYRKHLQKYI